jgi:hypothetical protein
MAFWVRSSSIYLAATILFSFIYFSTLVRLVPISVVAQFGSLVALLFLTFTFRYANMFFLVVVALFLYLPFHERYILAFLALVFSYLVAMKISTALINLILISSAIISIACMVHFYLHLQIFYTPVYFSNYFFGFASRLLGLDSSPAYLSFIAGLGMFLSLFFIRTRWISVSLGLFFLFVVLLTASRTATLGIVLSLVFGLLKGVPFSAFVGVLILFPPIITYFYTMLPRLSLDYLIMIELATSHRVVNWANLLTYFKDLDPTSILFGIGKPTVISDAQFLQSETGLYVYKFVTYAESSILKILVYHGILVYIFAFGFMLYKSFFMRNFHSRVLVIYFIFSAIFYDAIFSLQYIYLSIFFFYVIRNDNLSREEKSVF